MLRILNWRIEWVCFKLEIEVNLKGNWKEIFNLPKQAHLWEFGENFGVFGGGAAIHVQRGMSWWLRTSEPCSQAMICLS